LSNTLPKRIQALTFLQQPQVCSANYFALMINQSKYPLYTNTSLVKKPVFKPKKTPEKVKITAIV